VDTNDFESHDCQNNNQRSNEQNRAPACHSRYTFHVKRPFHVKWRLLGLKGSDSKYGIQRVLGTKANRTVV
jgi:hypothetical protein